MGLLDGIRVIDLSRFLSGPYCSMILGDLGADVIKIEKPGIGDNTRRWTPGHTLDSPYFLSTNRNKRSLTLDITSEQGREVLERLVKVGDVLMHNLRPGRFEALGLSYERLQEINPRLVFCEITGFGRTGPESGRPAFDLTVQAESGLMALTGDKDGPPMKVGAPVADVMTSLMTCIGIQGALLQRERTGRGARVSTAMIEIALACMPNVVGDWLVGGSHPARWGNGHPTIVPYDVFMAEDGYQTIGIGSEAHWTPFCGLIGRPDLATDPRFANNPARVAHRDALRAELDPIIASKPRAYWSQVMGKLGLPTASVKRLDEVLSGSQIGALGTVQTVEHLTMGEIRMVRSPIQVDDEYLPIRRAPPSLGEHSDEILRELLGLSDSEIDALREAGTIGGKD